jgi:hypothetical protein
VVVAVSGCDVERHTEERLAASLVVEVEPVDGHKKLGVVVRPYQPEVQPSHRAQRVRVDLLPAPEAIEPPGHEVGAPLFFEQPALGHLDASHNRHLVIGVLGPAVVARGAKV